MPEIIRARDLVKRYGSFTAVDGISFAVRAGECGVALTAIRSSV